MSESEASRTRQEILDCIKEEGAVHKSELCRLVGRGWGTVSHHLLVLQREGLVDLESHGRNTWAFPAGLSPGERLRRMALNVPGRQDLLQFLRYRGATVGELSERLEESKKVVRTHLGHLVSAGLVVQEPQNPSRYRLRRRRDGSGGRDTTPNATAAKPGKTPPTR